MEDHFLFLYGPSKGPRSNIARDEKWSEIASELNGMAMGAVKNGKEWRQCFSSMRLNVQDKLREIRVHMQRTGGGAPTNVKLSEMDEQIIRVCLPHDLDGRTEQDRGFPTTTAISTSTATAHQRIAIATAHVVRPPPTAAPSPQPSAALSRQSATTSAAATYRPVTTNPRARPPPLTQQTAALQQPIATPPQSSAPLLQRPAVATTPPPAATLPPTPPAIVTPPAAYTPPRQQAQGRRIRNRQESMANLAKMSVDYSYGQLIETRKVAKLMQEQNNHMKEQTALLKEILHKNTQLVAQLMAERAPHRD